MNNRFIGRAGKPHAAWWDRRLGLCCELWMPSQAVDEFLVNEYCAYKQQARCLVNLNTSTVATNTFLTQLIQFHIIVTTSTTVR